MNSFGGVQVRARRWLYPVYDTEPYVESNVFIKQIRTAPAARQLYVQSPTFCADRRQYSPISLDNAVVPIVRMGALLTDTNRRSPHRATLDRLCPDLSWSVFVHPLSLPCPTQPQCVFSNSNSGKARNSSGICRGLFFFRRNGYAWEHVSVWLQQRRRITRQVAQTICIESHRAHYNFLKFLHGHNSIAAIATVLHLSGELFEDGRETHRKRGKSGKRGESDSIPEVTSVPPPEIEPMELRWSRKDETEWVIRFESRNIFHSSQRKYESNQTGFVSYSLTEWRRRALHISLNKLIDALDNAEWIDTTDDSMHRRPF